MCTSEFILAFIRPVNRYGISLVVYSNDAKCFVLADRIIEQLLSFFRICRYALYSFYCSLYNSCLCCMAWGTWERLRQLNIVCLSKVRCTSHLELHDTNLDIGSCTVCVSEGRGGGGEQKVH